MPAEKELQQAAKLSQTLHSVLTAELATTQPTGSAQRIRRVLVASDTEGRGEADAVWCCLPMLISDVLRGTAGPAGSPVVTPSPRATGLSAAIIHSHSRDFDWLLPACIASNIYCLVRDPLPTAHCQRHLLPACVLFMGDIVSLPVCTESHSHPPPPTPLHVQLITQQSHATGNCVAVDISHSQRTVFGQLYETEVGTGIMWHVHCTPALRALALALAY